MKLGSNRHTLPVQLLPGIVTATQIWAIVTFEIAPPVPMDGEAPTCTDPAGEEGTAGDESKAKDLKRIHTDIIYPSGLKLALLMMSRYSRPCASSLSR